MTQLLELLPTLALSAGAFILAILIIVTIHELGHYLVARWQGIGAETFSIGFGPELASFTDKRGTRWRLAALPLGGYVKFTGDASPASAPGAPGITGSFTDAPLRARALTVLAGPLANFLFAILVIAVSVMWSGVASEEPRVGAPRAHPVEAPFRTGDLIRSVNDHEVNDIASLLAMSEGLAPGQTVTWGVERDGVLTRIEGPRPMSPYVERVNPLSPAQRAGILPGDVVTRLNGEPVSDFSELRHAVARLRDAPITLELWRDGELIPVRITAERTDNPSPQGGFETRWMIGIGAGLPFEPALRRPGPVEALQIGAERTWMVVHLSGSALANIVTGAISHCNIRGVISMGEASGATASQGAGSFVMFLALLSVVIGFMNLLPIPTLDGGHLVMHAYEAVRGRAPNARFTSAMMAAGMVLLVGMMLLGLINDLTC